MTRSFENLDLVTLPRLDASGCVALAHSLEAAAAPFKDLPESVTKALGWIAKDREALQRVVGGTPR